MQARETQLLTLLAGQHQFVIPIFQRDYSWGGDECEIWRAGDGWARRDGEAMRVDGLKARCFGMDQHTSAEPS